MRQIDRDLYYASINGDLEKVKRAIENGADIDVKNDLDRGLTPLHEASINGHESVVLFLLEKGAYIEAKGKYNGRTPLHSACQNGHENIVSLLLEKGANVNAKDKYRSTPLHSACYNGYEAVVALLLDNGADPTITDVTGKTPLQVAQDNNKQNCVALFEQLLQQQQFQNECSETFKTRAALDRELQRLKEVMEAANDSVDPDVNAEAVTAKAEYEMILPLLKWPQYMSVSEIESEIARLEEQAQSMDIGEERMEVLLKRTKLKHYLEQEIEEGTTTPLQLAQKKLPKEIQWIFTCPISGCFMKDPVILIPSGRTFDRESICTWLLQGKVPPRCPWTHEEVDRQIPYMENRDTRNFLIYFLGEEAFVRYDDSTFKVRYEALWKAHNAESLFNKGVSYQDDDQFDVAAEYFEAAAAEGHAGAQYNLAVLNEDNHERMLGFLQQAAAQDHPDALYDLGSLYLDSDVVPQDLHRAQEYFQRAAAQGHNEALHFLGTLYSDSDHVPQDLNRAQEYFQQAAAEGHAGAQYSLAMLNKDNHERMLGYLEQAAGQDHLEALYYLGTLYYDSEVVPQDLNRARDYFQRAVDQGHSEAWKALESLPVKKARIS
jgi:TPR repeat protein